MSSWWRSRNGDFAVTMARQLIFSAYQYELYTRAAHLH